MRRTSCWMEPGGRSSTAAPSTSTRSLAWGSSSQGSVVRAGWLSPPPRESNAAPTIVTSIRRTAITMYPRAVETACLTVHFTLTRPYKETILLASPRAPMLQPIFKGVSHAYLFQAVMHLLCFGTHRHPCLRSTEACRPCSRHCETHIGEATGILRRG